MPNQQQIEDWIRRNEAGRRADEAADHDKTVNERLTETAALSRAMTELAESVAERDRA